MYGRTNDKSKGGKTMISKSTEKSEGYCDYCFKYKKLVLIKIWKHLFKKIKIKLCISCMNRFIKDYRYLEEQT